MREYCGILIELGKESFYRNRIIEENFDLFERMKNGEFKDGEKILRVKIDMFFLNINFRDLIIYRIFYLIYYNIGDKWCIYFMYVFVYLIEDVIEGIIYFICILEFED